MLKFVLATAVASVVLVACGGGGGDSPASAGTGGGPADPNAFDAALGTYKSGCIPRQYNSNNSSQDTTVAVSAPEGTNKAKVVITQKYYDNSTSCTGAPDEAFVGTGQITSAAVTKTITSGAKTGVASTAEFKYESVTISAGTFSVPSLGAVAKIGYLIEGGKLYPLSGKREADGLPSTFSSIVLTKQ